MYRVLYAIAHLLGYRVRDYVDFLRPLDLAFDWLFFVPGLIIVEVMIWIYYDGTCGWPINRSNEVINEETRLI